MKSTILLHNLMTAAHEESFGRRAQVDTNRFFFLNGSN